MPVTDVYSDMSRLIEHVRFASQRPLCGIGSEEKPSFVFRNRSVHSHFAESRVNLLLTNIALNGIHQSRKSPQGTAIEPML